MNPHALSSGIQVQDFTFILLKNYLFYLFMAVLGLHCWSGFALVAKSRSHSLVAVLGLFIVGVSLVVEHGF